MDKNILPTLKLLASKRMEMSIIRVREKDLEHEKKMMQVIGLEQEYESIDLEPGIKELVNNLLAARDEANTEQSVIAYLAGMEDCALILKKLGLLQL